MHDLMNHYRGDYTYEFIILYTQGRQDNVRRVTECGSNVVCKSFDYFFNGVFSAVIDDASILQRTHPH